MKDESGKNAASLRGAAGAGGDYIFETRRDTAPFRAVPRCLYFYYIGSPRRRATLPYIRHYCYSRIDEGIRYNELEELVRDLARNARMVNEGDQYPAPCGANLNYIVWSRKSYVAFLIDEEHAPGLFREFDRASPIALDPHHTGKTNHSFFDGWSKKIDLSDDRDGSEMRSAFCFMNHMKRDRDSDVGYHNYPMPFRLNLVPPWQRGYPDSGGTNMGPPIGPP